MAKEITKTELKASLRHYWRMRKWARNRHGSPDIDQMELLLGEGWDSDHCILCENYGDCYICPLGENGHICGDTEWNSMDCADTWDQWAEGATVMAEVIMKLPREKK